MFFLFFLCFFETCPPSAQPLLNLIPQWGQTKIDPKYSCLKLLMSVIYSVMKKFSDFKGVFYTSSNANCEEKSRHELVDSNYSI